MVIAFSPTTLHELPLNVHSIFVHILKSWLLQVGIALQFTWACDWLVNSSCETFVFLQGSLIMALASLPHLRELCWESLGLVVVEEDYCAVGPPPTYVHGKVSSYDAEKQRAG